jgi:DNA-binding PadR family transcriptional regulator
MRGYRGHHGDHGGGGGDGRRMRRGMVPDLVLAALLDGPAHGYELMDRLESFSGGNWRPSPGSIYPLLAMFEDKGVVESREAEGRRVFSLTAAGRAQAEQAKQRGTSDAGPAFAAGPRSPSDSQNPQLWAEMRQLEVAGRQIATLADPAQVEQAVEIVRNARKALYRLLAD